MSELMWLLLLCQRNWFYSSIEYFFNPILSLKVSWASLVFCLLTGLLWATDMTLTLVVGLEKSYHILRVDHSDGYDSMIHSPQVSTYSTEWLNKLKIVVKLIVRSEASSTHDDTISQNFLLPCTCINQNCDVHAYIHRPFWCVYCQLLFNAHTLAVSSRSILLTSPG